MQTQLSKENVDFKKDLEDFLKKSLKGELNLRSLWQELYKNNYIANTNSFLKNILLTETICKLDPGIGLFLLTHFANIEIIKSFGSEDIKNKHLENLISGKEISCFSLTEENAGSDISQIETNAVRNGNKWLINGKKIWASNGSICDLIILFAQTKEKGDKSGITAFLIDSKQKGIEIKESTPKLGIKTTPSNEIILKDVEVDEKNIIGTTGDGVKIALSTITNGRIFCSAQAIGLLNGVLEEAVKHSVKRNQFGKSISDFQAIQWYIADMSKDLDGARLLLYKTAWAKDTNSSELNKLSSMSKSFSTKAAQRHSSNAVQILGGKGLIEDSYVAKAYKDAKVLEIYEGTNEIQQLVIAREIL
jgi:alkylation response protein AidB-like acyl-CoA dehydrogenase